jgi:hypothetical protein
MPEAAARVRQELSTVLDSEGERFAELVVVTQLLQSAERGDGLELVPALRQRAEKGLASDDSRRVIRAL